MGFTLITGASSGIGEEFARQLAEKGHSLILTARSKEKLNQLAQELTKSNSIQVKVIEQDLSGLDSGKELFNKCQSLGLDVNFLINNAGIGLIERFDKHDLNEIQEMLIINMVSLTTLTYLFLPQLKQNQGTILNLASQVAFAPAPYMAAYGGTKAYVLSFTDALREELKEDHIKVMSLCPGPTYTNFFQRANASPDDINFKFRTPKEVVTEALEGLKNNHSITVTGWENKFWVFMTHLMPRSLLSKLSQFNVKDHIKK